MKALKKLHLFLFFLLIGCKKQELDEQLVKAILGYEKNVPIPKIKRENSSREYVFVYLVDFIKEKGDTIIKINRNSNGLLSKWVETYRISSNTAKGAMNSLLK